MFESLPEVAVQLNKDSSLTKKELLKYELAAKKGDHAENTALTLVKQFFDVEDAWLAKTGSLLDANCKVDLVVKLTGKTKVIGIQVKSSEHGAQEHESLRNVMHWEHGFPECLVLAPGHIMVTRLEELLGVKANKRVFKALTVSVQLKGRLVPPQVKGMKDLYLLSLATTCAAGYQVF